MVLAYMQRKLTRETLLSQETIHSSIHVIVANNRERQEPNWRTLIAWTDFFPPVLKKERNPRAKITFLCSFHPQSPSDGPQGWAGPPECSPCKCEHSATKASCLQVQASKISHSPVVQEQSGRVVFPPVQLVLDPELWLGWMIPLLSSPPPPIRGCRDYWSQAAVSDRRAHFSPPKFVTSGLSACELFLLAFRLWCSKACFWKNKYYPHPHPQIMVLFICNISTSHCFSFALTGYLVANRKLLALAETCGNLQATYTNPWIVVFSI